MKDFRLFDFKVADKSELGENDYSDDCSSACVRLWNKEELKYE